MWNTGHAASNEKFKLIIWCYGFCDGNCSLIMKNQRNYLNALKVWFTLKIAGPTPSNDFNFQARKNFHSLLWVHQMSVHHLYIICSTSSVHIVIFNRRISKTKPYFQHAFSSCSISWSDVMIRLNFKLKKGNSHLCKYRLHSYETVYLSLIIFLLRNSDIIFPKISCTYRRGHI